MLRFHIPFTAALCLNANRIQSTKQEAAMGNYPQDSQAVGPEGTRILVLFSYRGATFKRAR